MVLTAHRTHRAAASIEEPVTVSKAHDALIRPGRLLMDAAPSDAAVGRLRREGLGAAWWGAVRGTHRAAPPEEVAVAAGEANVGARRRREGGERARGGRQRPAVRRDAGGAGVVRRRRGRRRRVPEGACGRDASGVSGSSNTVVFESA